MKAHTKVMISRRMALNVYDDGTFLLIGNVEHTWGAMVAISEKQAKRLARLIKAARAARRDGVTAAHIDALK